jgi:hypothetical protein
MNEYRISDYIVFSVAVLFLVAILAAGFIEETIQRNVLYLVVLSLSCAMVFAFLSYDARFAYKTIFRAGGTAAVFAFRLYITTNFTEKGYLDYKRSADGQITSLKGIIDNKDKELENLRALVRGNPNTGSCSAQTKAVGEIIAQVGSTLKSLQDDINEGIQFSSAARDNYSDSRTCSMRGSQSLAALARALPRIQAVESNLTLLKDIYH